MAVTMVMGRDEEWLHLARLLWYETIQGIGREYPDEKPSSMYFHKITVLSYFRLKQQGIEFKFPYSWYLYGTEAENTGRDVEYLPDEDAHRTLVKWRGRNIDEFRQDSTADAIRGMVKRLILEFPPKEAERAVDEIYDNAPFEFQRKYRFVRIKIGTTGRGSRHGESVHAMEIGQLIEEAFDEFPPYGFDVPRRYQEVIHILLDRMSRPQPIGTFALLSEVIEEFWGLFCTYLRLDPLGNVLVDRKTIERWEDYAQMKFEIFQRNIGDIIVELCNSAPHLKEEQALAPIYEKRSREQSEEAQTIDEMADVFEDIDSTLAQLYGRPARR